MSSPAEQGSSTPENHLQFDAPLEIQLGALVRGSVDELSEFYHRGILKYVTGPDSQPIRNRHVYGLGEQYRPGWGVILHLGVSSAVESSRRKGMADEEIVAFSQQRLEALDAKNDKTKKISEQTLREIEKRSGLPHYEPSRPSGGLIRRALGRLGLS